MRDLNPRPFACKASALAAELIVPRFNYSKNYDIIKAKLRGRLMVGHQTLDLAILGSNPSPAALKFNLFPHAKSYKYGFVKPVNI